jgi:hypothetical protein
MAVHHVDVNLIGAATGNGLDLGAQPREVGR